MPIKNIHTWKDLSKQKPQRKKTADDFLQEGDLTDVVYDEKLLPDHKKNDPDAADSTYNKESKNLKSIPRAFRARFLILFVLLGAALAWVAGWWLFSVSEPNAGSLSVFVEAPKVAASGEDIKLQLKIENHEKADLQNSEITWQWPEGVRITSSSLEPLNDNMNIWVLPDLKKGESFVLEIDLQVFGEAGDQKDIQATLVYELANFSSVFFSDIKHSLTLGDPAISLDFSGPADTKPLSQEEWRLVVENLSDKDIKKGVLEISAPAGLLDISATPEANITAENKIIFPVENLAKNEKTVFKFEGMFAAGSQGNSEFVWRYGEATGEQVHIVQEGKYSIYVSGDEVELEILADKENTPSEFYWGDEVEFEFLAKNITDQELVDSEWEINMTGSLFDWNTLSSPFSVTVQKPGVLLFKSADNSVLQSLLPGEEKRVSFRVKLKTQPDPVSFLNIKAKFYTRAKSQSEKISFTRDLNDIKIGQFIKWHASAHYYDDEGVLVGSGPLPPQVGQATTYRIQFAIPELSSKVNRATVSTILPSGILWADQYFVNYGIISYSPSSREVVWVLNNIQSYDRAGGELSAYFDVRLVPNQDAVGSSLPLTGSIQLQAFRSDNTSKTMSQGILTTALEGDAYGQGKGIIQPAQ